MAKQKLRFKVKIEGKGAGVVAAITPPVDVLEILGRGRGCRCVGRLTGFRFDRR